VSAPLERERLQALADGARDAGRLALDTEFMGEGRYRTLLCLIQLAIPASSPERESEDAGERILVVDPLPEDFDGSALAEVLADPAIQIVVHAGRQDIALVRRRFDTEVRNVFDTQVAAGFAGLGAQSSYDSLLAEVLGLRVAKTASFTRWNARPLSPEQLAYAREDVVHLLELASELERRLDELGRLQWAREECEPLALSSDERDPETIFARLPRSATLNASARPIARELVKIRGVGSVSGGRRAEDLLDAVRRGREQPPDPPPPSTRAPIPKPDDAPLVALAEALLRARAREAGLAYELLAARADLQAIVAAARVSGDEADVRTLKGWRRELVGAELLELLEGRVSLSVHETDRGRRVQIDRD